MADIVDAKTRSRMMSGIRSKNTKPELTIRSGLHKLGFRYRLHDRYLPGKPDLVFPSRLAVIQVHGCFWHGHDCHLFKYPSSRPDFWKAKIQRNRENDIRNNLALSKAGWRTLIVWECAIKGRARQTEEDLMAKVAKWLILGTKNLELTGKGDGSN